MKLFHRRGIEDVGLARSPKKSPLKARGNTKQTGKEIPQVFLAVDTRQQSFIISIIKAV
jgi:hypothetical protein